MRVASIGYQYGSCNTGGAAIAATRLHLSLIKAGVESHYVCVHQCEDGPNVHVLPKRGITRLLYFVMIKVTRCIWKFTSYRKSICLNVIPIFGLEQLLDEIKPDVVHVQWINADVCSFEQLARLPYKLIFHLHDLYMINAIDPHPRDDTRFRTGFTKVNSKWLERWMFYRKMRLMNRSHGKMFSTVCIAPSQWCASMCQQSLIGKAASVRCISNLVDPLIRFHKEWRKRHRQFTILFSAFGGRKNSFKGWEDLVQALGILVKKEKWIEKEICIKVCGEIASDIEIDGVSVRFCGIITEASQLCELYHLSDVLAFPSRIETQGMVKIEALMCGLPVVAFDRTACAEGITHGQTGWIAHDCAEFAEGLRQYYRLFKNGTLQTMHETIARQATIEHTEKASLMPLLNIYSA